MTISMFRDRIAVHISADELCLVPKFGVSKFTVATL
jgi:hypothetical protein